MSARWLVDRSVRRMTPVRARAAVSVAAACGLTAAVSASWRFDGAPGAGLGYGDLPVVTSGGSGAFSCFCTVKLDALGADDRFMLGKLTTGGQGWELRLDASVAGAGHVDRVAFRVSDGPGRETERYFATEAVADRWYAVGGSYAWNEAAPSTGAMTLYVDGVNDPAPPRFDARVRVHAHTDPLTVGMTPGEPAATMDGRLGHVAIWDGVALTPPDQALLAAGADPRTIHPDHLVFYASLEDAEALDVVGNVRPSVGAGATFSVDRWPAFKPLVVTLGRVTPTSIRVLSHAGRASVHRLEYTTGTFPGVVSAPVTAIADDDYVAASELSGLDPRTTYRYRLVLDGVPIPAAEGSFTTAPAGDAARFDFVYASCSQFSDHIPPYPRYSFDAFRGILDRAPDFVVHSGDVWYADAGGHNETEGFNAWLINSAEAFARKARETLGVRPMAEALLHLPMYAMPDDHEWTNNISNVAGLTGINRERYDHAFRRILNWQFAKNPDRLPKAIEDGGLWYTFRYGGVDFFFLDVRTQRSANTAPNTAAKKMLGPDDRQLADLLAWLEQSTAAFKVILSPGMISRFGTTSNDAWGTGGGFSTDARAVIERIAAFDDVVFLAGDVHWSGAVRLRAHACGDPAHDLYEFIGSPYAGHLSAPSGSTDPDLLFTYDGRAVTPARTSYLLISADTTVSPATLDVRIVSHDPVSGDETIEYVHPTIRSRRDLPPRPADVNGDGVVDVLDLLAVLLAWGPCPGCPEDVTGDGVVDVADLLEVLLGWGVC